ncbi:ribosome silencing factor [Celeribacter baekdonensis]|uniref:Ribosomal silencing factor RsfS n=1 Tax=Celeribacter baekdonensis B30 TaxID=1208323 RepID=K2JIJ1_9RHOB|nr:iojap family protein [Celeribacter baekdonensis B30]
MTGAASEKFGGQKLLNFITDFLDQDKAEDIVTISLQGKSEMADYMVICSGRSTRQVSATAEKLSAALKMEHEVFSRIEGKDQGDWVLIDAGDVIVHIFRPEVREFYQLEKMWMSAEDARAASTSKPIES